MSVGAEPRNDACPIDCIQIPSLECENLICVATQIDGNYQNMNGRCGTDIQLAECTSASFGCMGYCTKECLTDAGCPKDYKCSAMAPFETTLQCDIEAEWASNCTASCIRGGNDNDHGGTCPDSGVGTDYGVCSQTDYSKCCACICYQFCPILAKKFCRKARWDESMFGDAVTTATGCGGGD
jgi:hypothetical protein